jgi:hypothetical protein
MQTSNQAKCNWRQKLLIAWLVLALSMLPLAAMAGDTAPETANTSEKTSTSTNNALPATKPTDNSSTTTPAGKPAPKTAAAESKTTAGANTPHTSSASHATNAPKATPGSHASVLYGRIEEIAGSAGARFPITFKTQKGKFDTSEQKQNAQYSTGVIVNSFPFDFRGTWQGALTIYNAEFSPALMKFDAKETKQNQALTRRGTQGQVTFQFANSANGNVNLEPATIVFQTTLDNSQYAGMLDQVKSVMPDLSSLTALGGSQGSPIDANAIAEIIKAVPIMYALHFGGIEGAMGTTGNALSARLVKNELKRLRADVVEQSIITYDRDVNRDTGKQRLGYTESVVRFYKQSANQLYVQAASVGYDQQGNFQSKVILYGTVTKAQ